MNMQNIEVETGTERPIIPPKLLSAIVAINPFDDVVARPNVKGGRMSSEPAPKSLPPAGGADLLTKRKAEKKTALLSFGDEEGEVEEDPQPKKKIASSHDVLHDPKLAKTPAVQRELIE